MLKEGAKEVIDILREGDQEKVRVLFQFNKDTEVKEIVLKFNLWVRYFFPKYFESEDADFHKKQDTHEAQLYKGDLFAFVNIAFRGAAKTTRKKLFIAYAISNDTSHHRKYLRILSKDLSNATQSVTDIYNILIDKKIYQFYPEIFKRTGKEKREETMSSFTTSFGVKLIARTVGVEHRGQLQEETRPDYDWYDDFETRKSLYSATETKKIWDNMEEARNGLAKHGASEYTCNYLSESGNVHRLIQKYKDLQGAVVMIIPIKDKLGNPMWPSRYTKEEIQKILELADDPEGEYMCNPVAGFDVFIDRERIDAQEEKMPKQEIAKFKIFHEYNPSHRLAGGHDIAGGVGLDSSASVFIDFSTIPAKVVATYANNNIIPEDFGYEMIREAAFFGNCLVAPERNYGTEAILVLKQKYKGEIYQSIVTKTGVNEKERKDYGWNTNRLTKPDMLHGIKKAVEDGLLELSDPALIAEARSYTRNDLMDNEIDPRLTTRHFDLFIACAIAWQMKDEAEVTEPEEDDDAEPDFKDEAVEQLFTEIGA